MKPKLKSKGEFNSWNQLLVIFNQYYKKGNKRKCLAFIAHTYINQECIQNKTTDQAAAATNGHDFFCKIYQILT